MGLRRYVFLKHCNKASIFDAKDRYSFICNFRSGKSSIQKVVFHKMSPNETLFLESTNKIVKDDINNSSFVQFQIWDFPGQIDFFDSTFDYDMIFGGCGALIFVIDAQVMFLLCIIKTKCDLDSRYANCIRYTIKTLVYEKNTGTYGSEAPSPQCRNHNKHVNLL